MIVDRLAMAQISGINSAGKTNLVKHLAGLAVALGLNASDLEAK